MTGHPDRWDPPDRSRYAHYNHLLTEAAQTRYVLAAQYVEGCRHVVEIGGSRTPITRHVRRPPESILVVDPKMDPFHADTLLGRRCRVDHLRTTFQAHEFDLARGSYGLVMLGLSLKHFADDEAAKEPQWRKLIGLVNDAAVTVIEHPIGWALSHREVDDILAQTATRVRLEIEIDLGDNEGEDTPFPRRRFMVLDPDPA